jgi:ATP-dependent helicase/nuclease subunit B
MLSAKLHDIGIVYDRFKQYLHDNYITSEEILDVLCDYAGNSEILKNSELVFDGFTGFTPIQYKLIKILLETSKKITVTVTIDVREKINVSDGMENLFFMSKEMISRLHTINDEVFRNEKPLDDILIEGHSKRFKGEKLAFLEENLFRGRFVRYKAKETQDNTDENSEISLYNAKTCKEEMQYAASEIIRLTRFEGYRYRDIAIVSGDMSAYGVMAGNILKQNGIPVFVDAKKPVTDNPLVELVRGILDVLQKNYSYDTVFRYLRSGLTGISRRETDILENYCLATGIHGSSAWHNVWTRKGRSKNNFDIAELNAIRERIIQPIVPLEEILKNKKSTVRERVVALYEFICRLGCFESLMALAKTNDSESEYEQIYKKTIELFDKMVELMGDHVVELSEFARIIDSGFQEIKVGLIPAVSDCVMIGDIERTRLDDIKVLFFMGMNEGIIPKKNDNRGVLSEADRDCLESMDVELSADAHRKAFVQRLYLYLILTKPSDRLYLSFANKGNDGAGLLPSYIIRVIRQMFPELSVTESSDVTGQLGYIRIPKSELVYEENQFIEDLGETLALQLYGEELYGSVSAFEKFTGCMFSYFLKTGLELEERDEYSFEVTDFGTVMHSIIENVCREMKDEKRPLGSLSDEERLEKIEKVIGDISKNYSDDILFDTSRNTYLITRMTKLADRTLWALGRHMDAGSFNSEEFELEFRMDTEQLALDEGYGRMVIKGKIDRIDIFEDDENVYVRIVDYKSGNSQFDLLQTYYGIKMQLVTYMNAAMQYEKKHHKGKHIVPAGIYYYNISDPILEVEEDIAQNGDELEKMTLEKLRMDGATNSNENIIKMMDGTQEDKSLVIPVEFKKDGSAKKSGKLYSTDQLNLLGQFMSRKMKDIGKQILDGSVSVNPYSSAGKTPCEYCPYSAVCGFSGNLKSGYRYLKKFEDAEMWENMEKGVDENGKQLDD